MNSFTALVFQMKPSEMLKKVKLVFDGTANNSIQPEMKANKKILLLLRGHRLKRLGERTLRGWKIIRKTGTKI